MDQHPEDPPLLLHPWPRPHVSLREPFAVSGGQWMNDHLVVHLARERESTVTTMVIWDRGRDQSIELTLDEADALADVIRGLTLKWH
jgi:hypothetical protein